MLRKSLELLILGLLVLVSAECQKNNIEPGKLSGKIPKVWRQVSREEILAQKNIPVFTYKIIKKYPHDVTSYTEGLFMNSGYLYESTGRYNQSKLLKKDLETGKTLKQHKLGPRYFGEGITIFENRIFQLTYKSNVGFIYDKNTFELKGAFYYPTQGWGLTTDGNELIMSDGSAALLFLSPKTLEQTRYVIVSDDKGEVGFLNELEYVKGEVYANVWKTNLIARIAPETGKVTGWIDLTGINPDHANLKSPYVLNGIAYDRKNDRLIISGKCWPELYEIELVPLKNR